MESLPLPVWQLVGLLLHKAKIQVVLCLVALPLVSVLAAD
jgi:hypothetical protein